MNEYRINPWYEPEPDWSGESFSFLRNDDMLEFHRTLPGYNPTELKSLPVLAEELGLGAVYVKDESARFGIKSFKALGASYAIFSCLNTEYRLRFGESLSPADFISGSGKLDLLPARIFCAATDGNHGRAVAWTARMLKQQAIIYMPADSALQRIKNIENEGACVVLVEGTFDDCVGLCDRDARKKGWQVLSDTAYAGYMEIPKYIMLGYTSIFNELEGALLNAEDPGTDIVFLQTGVGGLSAAAAAFYAKRFGNLRPRLVCVEPVSSDCFLESIKQGMPSRSRGR
ncbi:MAG: pyridoxal-phosphate dependent enzyme, partial [Spirochaetales bacterium]